MASTPTDLMECAAKLARATDGDEATARAAVSRAYYAAYHDCLQWYNALPAAGQLPQGSSNGTHVEFAERLKHPDPTLTVEQQKASRRRGLALRQLHGDRVVADYYLNRNVTPMNARNAMSSARAIAAL